MRNSPPGRTIAYERTSLCGFEEARLEDPLLLVPPGMSTMAYLASITVVLIILGNIKMVAPRKPMDLDVSYRVRDFK